ncbi:hypothetical protein PILCRDRAFT_810263 [Piloderma croceum F 1598]|uniref:Uncharacterized protein n=1 Tax=Piloderma croceum (strain F 1598) TaxID=765440 RepID=A0A0C3CRE6_PILCF|nr:hypothetical protein PILCRDRAFT_810263 [Piloderma croceum F 1598]
MSKLTDPRDASLESKLVFPHRWPRDYMDALSTSGMFLSGLIMVTRNRYMSWPALMLAINGLINQHPLREKESASSPWATLMLAIASVLVSYSPLFIVSPTQIPTSTPLS